MNKCNVHSTAKGGMDWVDSSYRDRSLTRQLFRNSEAAAGTRE